MPNKRRFAHNTSLIVVSNVAKICCLILLFLNSNQTQAAETAFTPIKAVNFKKISNLRFSPDAKQLAFVLKQFNGNEEESHLWILQTQTEKLQQYTFSDKTVDKPEWSPDGNSLAFLSKRNKDWQVYVLSSKGGEAKCVTSNSNGVDQFHWSSDGTKIAFLAQQENNEQTKKNDAQFFDQDSSLDRLWTVDLASEQVKMVTKGTWKIADFNWCSNDEWITIATNKPWSENRKYSLYKVSAQDGKFNLFSTNNTPISMLTLSPDLRTFAYTAPKTDGPVAHDLFIQKTVGGPATNLSEKIDRPVSSIKWRSNNTLYFSVSDGFYSRLYCASNLNSAPHPINLRYSTDLFDVANDGTIAFIAQDFDRLPDIFLTAPDGKTKQVSHLQEGWENTRLSNAEIFQFDSFDGTSIEAALMKPKSNGESKKFPLILLVHGGPCSNYSARYYWFASWAELLVARGYEVLKVNPRGSTGYGEKFMKLNRYDWGGGDYKDLMAAVDYAIAHKNADPERLGIGGWSYGGEMTAWACTQSNRFKAAVSGACVFDQTMEFETEKGTVTDEWLLGNPWDNPDIFAKTSPSRFIQNAKTPTLIVHMKDDATNPAGHSKGLYRALKRNNVETELVLYPESGHIPTERNHQIDILERMLDWYDKHLGNVSETQK